MTTQQKQQQIKVRYNETSAVFASQFILNTSTEDIIINFSSGPLSDPSTGETILPVHTRIALTREGARRLHAVLDNILNQKNPNDSIPTQAKAKLPDIKQ